MLRVFCLLTLALICGSTIARAAERDDVLKALGGIPSAERIGLNAWIPGQQSDRVMLGRTLSYQMTTRVPAHLTVLQVNSQGALSILLESQRVSANHVLEFPPPDYEMRTTLPFGQESVVVLASEQPLDLSNSGVITSGGFRVLDSAGAMKLAQRLAAEAGNDGVAIAQLDYEIVPTTTASGAMYTADGIVKYFGDTIRSVHRRRLDLYIQFDFESDSLTEAAQRELDVVGEALNAGEIEKLEFDLIGHTDDQGAEEFNMDLSKRRAEAARAYLLRRYGIAAERLGSRGLGESEPMMEGSSEEARSRNRRVVIEVRRPDLP